MNFNRKLIIKWFKLLFLKNIGIFFIIGKWLKKYNLNFDIIIKFFIRVYKIKENFEKIFILYFLNKI